MATCTYISGACRNTVSVLDICSTSLFYENTLAFGISNALAIANTHDDGTAKITHTFVHHSDKINAVKWIKGFPVNKNPLVITGSNDKTAIVWSARDHVFMPLFQLKGHKNSITSVDGIHFNHDNHIVLYSVTASTDSSIKIWKKPYKSDEIQEIQTIDLGSGICLCVRFSKLPSTNTPLLITCLDDGKIHIYAEMLDNNQEHKFIKVETLIGHEDWVRDVDFLEIDDTLLIASCSQDSYVRIWSITSLDKNIQSLDGEIKIEKKNFKVSDQQWTTSLETVLSGHEGWVYSVHWHFNENNKQKKLLSSSFDKTLIIWEPGVDDGIWIEKVRVGEVGGGGLGFYGGKFNPDGNSIIGHSYTGSFHIWKYNQETDSWVPSVTFGGHFKEVVDLQWEPNGEFIFSASTDQTTRIHCPWNRSQKSNKITWHELARPQIHGYDMSCLAVISRYQYVSGAEEKIIRAFSAPHNFISNFNVISQIKDGTEQLNNIPEGASVPSLGLSNKAVFSSDTISKPTHVKDQYPENYFTPVEIKEPPTEEILMQNTLWPETNKLYGHGYEIFALAASQDGQLLASSCKSTNAQHAAIFTWSTKTWLQVQSLESHNLTVTQLAFSPNNLYLLSVSRDRRWSLFRRNSLNDLHFSKVCSSNKENGIHTRIIWCCAWTHDSNHFVTGSRDGKLVLWTKESASDSFKNVHPVLDLPSESITSAAIANEKYQNCYIVAAGFELGQIHIFSLQIENPQPWNILFKMDNNLAHHLTVRRLSFRPKVLDDQKIELASASNDSMLKLYSIEIKKLLSL